MNIDFGLVSKYFPNRGFGFVTKTFFSGYQSEVFFHIKNIKRTHPDLAERLSNKEFIGGIYFWYETECTSNGEQVCVALKSVAISEVAIDNLSSLVDKMESKWRNIYSTIPIWLHEVTVDLVGADRASELSSERESLESGIIEYNRNQQKKSQDEIEFELLVIEIEPLGLVYSNELSSYIMTNKLCDKYQNISGIVRMEESGARWDFKGGFPVEIYARLCKRLELKDQGTRAKVVGFESFKDLKIMN